MFMTLAANLRHVALIVLLAALSGCSALGALGDATTPLDVYDLRAPEGAPVARGGPLSREVIVEVPTTSGVLNTDRIMIRPDALQAQYLPDARWGDEVPVMIQTLMLRALENTGGLRYVGRRPLAGSGDFAIVTELMDFQAEVANGSDGAIVVIRLTSRIVRESDARVVASQTFSTRAVAASTDTADVVAAFDEASDQLLIAFADWTFAALGRRLSTT
jgi:cholesterol transport system auxiliary component